MKHQQNGESGTSWYKSYSAFPYDANPFFIRGGRNSDGGEFAFAEAGGGGYEWYGFRPTLIIP